MCMSMSKLKVCIHGKEFVDGTMVGRHAQK